MRRPHPGAVSAPGGSGPNELMFPARILNEAASHITQETMNPQIPAARLMPYALFFALAAFSAYCGLLGVDFGTHWDEQNLIGSLAGSVRSWTFLPNSYVYPSVYYDLSLLYLAPDIISCRSWSIASYNLGGAAECAAGLADEIQGHDFLLGLRGLFVSVTYMALAWTFLTVLAWGRNPYEALLASALLGLSWEVGYHSRWVAPDAIMMQFSALALMLMARSRTGGNPRMWLRLSAAAVGLAVGAKYPANVLLAPLLIAGYLSWTEQKGGLKTLGSLLLELLIVSAAAFLATTPGAILQPVQFFMDYYSRLYFYAFIGHMCHTVEPGLPHLYSVFTYLSRAALSGYQPVSAFFFAMALVGAYSVSSEDRKNAALLLSFPALYALLISMTTIFIPRNLLVLIPPLAVLSARGCFFAWERLRKGSMRLVFGGAVALMLCANAWLLLAAAESIQYPPQGGYVGQLAEYVDARPGQRFLASDRIIGDLAAYDSRSRPNVARAFPGAAEAAIIYFSETDVEKARHVRSGIDYAWRWFGPAEVNMDYYPNWLGRDRIAVMPLGRAVQLGCPNIGWGFCDAPPADYADLPEGFLSEPYPP
jgi:hypothetical protein